MISGILSVVLCCIFNNNIITKESKRMEDQNKPSKKSQFWCLLSPEELKKAKSQLSAESIYITQEDGTERPFQNPYWNHKEAGIYVDIVSGEPLFSSLDKFDSGTGWPSFTKPLEKDQIKEHHDTSIGIQRTEVRSKIADSHLGHLFSDGPGPTGLRYCINSAALKFIPKAQLKEKGYEDYLKLFGDNKALVSNNETAVLAGGCFWGMEELFRNQPGVLDTTVGYIGGATKEANYDIVRTGKSGHAEALRIEYNPAIVSYEKLLTFFFKIHDPTTLNQQGNDKGSQYRSAIFYFNESQKKTANDVIARASLANIFKNPIVTELIEATTFHIAEDFHQDYLQKVPNGYTCHYIRRDINF